MRIVALVVVLLSGGCGTVTTRHVGVAFLAAGATAMGVSAATEGYSLSKFKDPEKPKEISDAAWDAMMSAQPNDGKDMATTRLALGVGIGGVFALVGAILLGWDYIADDDGRHADPRNVLNPQ